MAGRIRDEDIEAVRQRTDLAKVVSGYLTLKKSGHDSLSGLCPFHSEKSPSFSVSPSKQVYYCFGCGAGGDAVRFLQEIESLSFVEAIERLANDTGVTLRFEGESAADKKAAGRRVALNRANEEACRLFHQALLDSPEAEEARSYLDERGIDRAAAERFGVGYAPRQADYLIRKMSKQVSSELLVEAGLVAGGEGGTRDRFRGRITFPIRDLSGRYVGFGARILPSAEAKAQKQAKYLNTSESPVYRKGELLYNLDAAKSSITRSGEVVIVEGYTDVISLVLAGVENVVATCGTALTESHLRTLARFAQRAVLTFDADEAGARAAERAFAFHESSAIHPFVLILPDGQDPSDFARAHGGEAFRGLAASAHPLVEFMIRRAVGRIDLSTVEGRTAAVDAGFPIIEGLSDPVRRQEYAHLLAELAGVSDDSVMLKLQRAPSRLPASQGGQGRVAKQASQGPPARMSPQDQMEREMLKLLARDRTTYDGYSELLGDEHFQSQRNRDLLGVLRNCDGDIGGLVATSGDDKLVATVSQLAVEPLEGEPTSEYAAGVWQRLQEFQLQRRSADMRRELQKLNPVTDPGYDEMFQRLIALDGDLRRLKQGGEA